MMTAEIGCMTNCIIVKIGLRVYPAGSIFIKPVVQGKQGEQEYTILTLKDGLCKKPGQADHYQGAEGAVPSADG